MLTTGAGAGIGYLTMRNQVTHSETSRYFVQSLSNGLRLLECFGKSGKGLTLMEISRELDWTKTSTFRYLTTLSVMGYVELEESTRRYRPTVKVLNLGYASLSALTFPELALPFLERLSRKFGESTNMAVLDGTDVVYVARVGSRRILATNLHVGSRLPVHCTSMGKVLLAYLDEAERAELVKKIVFTPHTPKTIAGPEKLRRALDQVRRQGYAVNDQELDIGLWSCSAPVFDKAGRVPAAINISTSRTRVRGKELVEKFVPSLLETGREITNVLKSRY